MRYAKILGLLAVMAAALMAVAGSVSAATLTDKTGNVLGVGTTIHAESEGATKLDGTVTITCQKSTVHGHITNAGGKHGGTTTTVEGEITTLTFTECGNNTVTVSKPGKLIVHSIGKNTGTLTSTGAEVTVLTHNILGTIHCIYGTNGTHIGTLTGSEHGTNTTATLDIGSAPIPRVDTTADFCGNDAEWTGNYSVITPDHVYVD